ncbi:adenylate/guanylate cyclase domain-containing protein [Mesorhizobium sp. NBSH29]|nr:adenylate/guanylate cyclase domain-containing protein [Mesorhizobium sp. NBSH29]
MQTSEEAARLVEAARGLNERRKTRLGALMVRAEREGARLQFYAGSAALLSIAVFFALFSKWDAALAFIIGALLLFFALGLFSYRRVKEGNSPWWLPFLVGALNIILLTFLIAGDNPYAGQALPAAMDLRGGGYAFLLIFVCLSALTLAPKLTLWLGVVATASWGMAIVYVVMQPNTILGNIRRTDLTNQEKLQLYLDPNFADMIELSAHLLVLMIITGILYVVVTRSRKLVDDYAAAERARINLARHFSPNVVDDLSTADEPFGPVRRQDVAILFADIVGFTTYSEDHSAEEVFELLREFHRRMEQVVFDHAGTVDNYIGDCIMATFGVPSSTHDDATRALRCAEAMAQAVRQWNVRREQHGYVPVDVRIGCQYGPVVVGAVGSERSLSIAVVGDAVNVASRLQALCREVDAAICFGAALIEAVRRESGAMALGGLEDHGLTPLRGRDELVDVWVLRRS